MLTMIKACHIQEISETVASSEYMTLQLLAATLCQTCDPSEYIEVYYTTVKRKYDVI